MDETYFNLISEGKIGLDYIESPDGGDPYLSIDYETAELKKSIDEEDFTDYVVKCLFVASMAGFEAPSEYYKAIKAFVSERDAVDAMNDFKESLDDKSNR